MIIGQGAKNNTLLFISGLGLILLGYVLISSGFYQTTIASKNVTIQFAYTNISLDNSTQIANTTSMEAYEFTLENSVFSQTFGLVMVLTGIFVLYTASMNIASVRSGKTEEL